MKKPVFIKITEYKELKEIIMQTTEKINEANKLLEEIEEIKRKEDQEIKKWDIGIKETKEKINEIKNILDAIDEK